MKIIKLPIISKTYNSLVMLHLDYLSLNPNITRNLFSNKKAYIWVSKSMLINPNLNLYYLKVNNIFPTYTNGTLGDSNNVWNELYVNTIKFPNKIKSRNDLNKTDFLMVDFSDKIKNSDNEIRYFLRSKMYNNKNVLNKNNKGKLIIKKLFAKISKNPAKFISKEHLSKNKYRSVSDFISGMTDRYAINLYNDIK